MPRDVEETNKRTREGNQKGRQCKKRRKKNLLACKMFNGKSTT